MKRRGPLFLAWVVAGSVLMITEGMRSLHSAPAISIPVIGFSGLGLLSVIARPYFLNHRADLARAILCAVFLILAVMWGRAARSELASGDVLLAALPSVGAAGCAWVGTAGLLVVAGGIAERRGRDGWVVRFSRRHRFPGAGGSDDRKGRVPSKRSRPRSR